jgi:hypothetical protein
MIHEPGDSTPARVAIAKSLLGLSTLVTAFVGLHRAAESDVFWHLMQGRAVLRHMSRVVPEPTAFPELARQTKVAAWLWDVLAYATQRAGGFPALAWLTAAFALCAGLALIWMLAAVRPVAPAFAHVLVAGLALASMTSRVRARPEVAALLMLPLLVGALYRFADEARGRARHALLAAAVALLWAQLHGSFLQVLPIAAALLGPVLVVHARDAELRRATLGLALALLVASLSSSSGMHVFGYAAEHAAADIKLHNAEMHPPLWTTFNPLQNVYGPMYVAMALLALLGAALARRVYAELALAALGAVIVTQSVRFLTIGTLLSAPLALHGARELLARARGVSLVLAYAACCALPTVAFARALARAEQNIGPLGRLGLVEHVLPLSSARYLALQPANSRVLTEYDAGGSLGFWLDGRVRTFVDSRTMVLFDDLQFALARDAFHSRAVLDRTAQRYAANLVVVKRSDPICEQLSAPWQPVVVEPLWTTFSRAQDAVPLAAVAPCGADYLRADACAQDGTALQRDVSRLRALRPSAWLDYLDATRLAACSHDLGASARRLPAPARAEGFAPARDLLAARLALAGHGNATDFVALAHWAADGDMQAWDVLRRALLAGKIGSPALLPFARAAVARLDDAAPAELRETLAELCIDAGDVDCAEFQGMRAAVAGSPHADPLLHWLEAHARDEGTRRDAAAWRRALRAAP